MELEGSCQCGKVKFTVESDTPIPYQYCYCSICRKTEGAFGCNIMGRRETLRVRGGRFLVRYHARVRRAGKRTAVSRAERCFCARCGTHLFLLDDEWPDGVWPNACAIDTPLPEAPSNVHLMLRYKPKWVPVSGRGPRYQEYPELSIADWHKRHARPAAKRRA